MKIKRLGDGFMMRRLLSLLLICGVFSFLAVTNKASNAMSVQTGINYDEVADLIRKQGKKQNAYYFPGLFTEELNVDLDPELEVLARTHGGVHLGDFFIFDKQSEGSYKLIFEQPWNVESWDIEHTHADLLTPLVRIITLTGGTGLDVREAHLMYMHDRGVWTEAWIGTLKERTVFEDNVHLIMGSYQLNDDNGQLFYWQTVMDVSLETNEQIRKPQTTLKVYELMNGRFVEKN
ncbi:hypothetical protein [Paenibacillus sedimenti]|uniref:Uncharacterized protein n=1 Tax=Paenibacillus sedimenti TaxID=2770274 RepID=A0A926KZ39_9BACL|nr:hypothetical protein [Paenibacillus sedimenti]MBD0384764.1 hypothetical protein [Paenibacillus sedimenti]